MKYLLRITFFAVSLACVLPSAFAQERSLDREIRLLLADKDARVGVAVLFRDSLVVAHNAELRFPLLSVFKYPVALAVLHRMDRGGTSLDSLLDVRAEQLRPDTYSPLRDRFPARNLRISLGELLRYSVSMSDNNACDILIDYAGGIDSVNAYVRRLCVGDFTLVATEADMHVDLANQYLNAAAPATVTRLLQRADSALLFAPEYNAFLQKIMQETATGVDKLKGLLPPSVVVGHKTGSSDRTPDGRKIGDNDAGYVILPSGERYYIAILISDSHESDATNASIIARISRLVYDCLSNL